MMGELGSLASKLERQVKSFSDSPATQGAQGMMTHSSPEKA